MSPIPIIPKTKNYWLVRTQGGRYYTEYRRDGFIAIGWNEISLQDIDEYSSEEIAHKIKMNNPEIRRPSTAANQLRVFKNNIKKGDTVVITGVASNKFTIGEVIDNDSYFSEVSEESKEEIPNLCPYEKRKKVRWIKEVHKWDVDMPMFKLLQHAQHTITDADDYKDVIESMINDFYIRGDLGHFSLEVKKEDNIPLATFFSLGKEIMDIAEEFNNYSNSIYIDLDTIDTQINVNSPGKIKFRTSMYAALALGLIIVGAAGGGVKFSPPSSKSPASFELKTNSVIKEVSDFLNDRQKRNHKELILSEYMDDLEIKTPDELSNIIRAIEGEMSDSE